MRSADPGSGRAVAATALDRVLFAAAVAISLFVLFWPSAPGPPLFPNADKIIHAAVFAALAWTAVRAGAPIRLLVIALGAYAAGSEITQHLLLPGRSGSWSDALADLIGAALGLLVAGLSVRRHGR